MSSSSSSSSSSASGKQVQWGRASDSDSSEESEEEIHPSASLDSENVNEMLRHFMPQAEAVAENKHMSRVLAGLCTVVIQETHKEINILRELNRMPRIDINLEYVPLDEKYKLEDFDMEVIIDTREDFLNFKKLTKELSWLEKITKLLVNDLQRTFYFEDLEKILGADQLNKDEEKALLSAKEFNRREVQKLRHYIDTEKIGMGRIIQELTEKLGNTKDVLNDNMVESKVTLDYIKKWEKSRSEQNTALNLKKENGYKETSHKMEVAIDEENRVHDEMLLYMEISIEEYKGDIEKWMEKYDEDLENKEQDVEAMKISIENQREDYELLLNKYNGRQQEMDDFKAYKIEQARLAQELIVRTKAAIIIQRWWRVVMQQRHLGPYRRKKRKNRKGGSAKNSPKNKKKPKK